MYQSTSVPVLVQLSKAHSCLLIDEGIQALKKQPSDNSTHTMASMVRKTTVNPGWKHMYLTNTLQSQNLNFIALLVFYLITGALERSTFSSGIDSKDSSFWGQTTTRPDSTT